MYVYLFIKCVVRWSENSVRFEKILWEMSSRWAKVCEISSHIVRYGIYDPCLLYELKHVFVFREKPNNHLLNIDQNNIYTFLSSMPINLFSDRTEVLK